MIRFLLTRFAALLNVDATAEAARKGFYADRARYNPDQH